MADENVNFFDMADDEFISQSDALEAQVIAEAEAAAEEQTDENILPDEGGSEDSDNAAGEDSEVEDESTDGDVVDSETDTDAEQESDEDEDPAETTDDNEGEEDESETSEEQALDPELAKIYAPFKANGKMIQVKNADEAVTLMQKGANYNKKMASLKPAFKVAKMLENNELLDEQTVSYLIDLQNGNPEALKKLIADKGINLDDLDIDGDKDPEYVPTTKHKVTDEELALDEVLSQVRETDTYEATMNLVGKEWDESSKNKLVQNPSMLLKLNEHMGNGVYQQIADEMARQDALGQLSGLSDLDAYFKVGNELMSAGKFDVETQEPTKTEQPQPDPAKKQANEQRKSKRKSAAPTKAKKPTKEPEINPFDMDDDEFEKQFGNSIY